MTSKDQEQQVTTYGTPAELMASLTDEQRVELERFVRGDKYAGIHDPEYRRVSEAKASAAERAVWAAFAVHVEDARQYSENVEGYTFEYVAELLSSERVSKTCSDYSQKFADLAVLAK